MIIFKSRYMTTQEASEYLGLSESTIRTYIAKGRLKSRKIYSSLVIPKKELKRYKAERLKNEQSTINR